MAGEDAGARVSFKQRTVARQGERASEIAARNYALMATQSGMLEMYIPFLINRVSTSVRAYSKPEFEKIGLTIPRYRALVALSERGTCRAGELCELTSIEMPTMTRIIKALQNRKLVRRQRAAADDRAVELSLTTAGRSLLKRTMPLTYSVETLMTSGLKPTDIKIVRDALTRMYLNLQSAD
jgi:MarR family transcriptional regulator, organic hydroperoxide resistance regulator